MKIIIVTNDINDAIQSRLPFASYVNKSEQGYCDVAVLTNKPDNVDEVFIEEHSLIGLLNIRRRIKKGGYTHVIIRGVQLSLLARFFHLRNQNVFLYITGLGRLWGIRNVIKSAMFRALFKFHLLAAVKFLNARVWVQNSDDLEDLAIDAAVINGSGIAVFDDFQPAEKLNKALYAGRLMYSKGFIDLIDFAIKSRDYNIKLIVCGTFSNDIKKADIDRFKNLVSEDIIEYKGYVKDVNSVMHGCAFCFYPTSYREGTPRFVLQGMSSGLIPIIPNAPGCRLILSEGRAIEYKGVNETLRSIGSLSHETYLKWAKWNHFFAQTVYKDNIVFNTMIKELKNV